MEMEINVPAGVRIDSFVKDVKNTFDFVYNNTKVKTVYFVFNGVKVVCDKNSTVESLIESYRNQIFK
jgi:hypothetical protein